MSQFTDKEYQKLHKWLRKKLGKAIYCSNNKIHKAKMYDWANISGEYKKDINDFKPLCRSCHIKMDFTEERRKHLMGRQNHIKHILQLDTNQKILHIYNSLKQASEELDITYSNISKVLRGIRKTAGSYSWRYI